MYCSYIYSKSVELTTSINTIHNLRPILSMFAQVFQKFPRWVTNSCKINPLKNVIFFIFLVNLSKNMKITIR